jgi:hypothetical protein
MTADREIGLQASLMPIGHLGRFGCTYAYTLVPVEDRRYRILMKMGYGYCSASLEAEIGGERVVPDEITSEIRPPC